MKSIIGMILIAFVSVCLVPKDLQHINIKIAGRSNRICNDYGKRLPIGRIVYNNDKK